MKKLILNAILALSVNSVIAQTWGGSMSQTGNTYRLGNTGIGTTTPAYMLHIANSATTSGTAVRIDAINGHVRLFETDGTGPNTNYTQIERNADAFHIYQNNGSVFKHVLTANMSGNVGLGTPAPGAALHVHSEAGTSLILQTSSVNNADIAFKSGTNQADILNYNTSNNIASILRFNYDGTGSSMDFTSYSPGGTNPVVNFKVASNGITYAKEIIVQTAAFPDYVFAKDYKLMPLDKVNSFIQTNHHLPNIPSAADVVANGIAVGEMQVKQMEKIEELYLHLIQMEERLKLVEQENVVLKKKLSDK